MFYYALQVATGKEQTFITHVTQKYPDFMQTQKLIYLTRELMIRRHGRYQKEKHPLFASYLFLETETTISADTVQKLKAISGFYHFLRTNADITPLSPSDLSILQHFMKLGPTVGASLVTFDEHDRIVVLEGPLKGLEGCIIKVDRRKKRAKITVDFENSPMTIDLAFEVLQKDTTSV